MNVRWDVAREAPLAVVLCRLVGSWWGLRMPSYFLVLDRCKRNLRCVIGMHELVLIDLSFLCGRRFEGELRWQLFVCSGCKVAVLTKIRPFRG